MVTISSPVAGDAILAGSTINVNGPGKIGRDLLAASSSLTLRAPVGRDVKASAGTLTLASNVGGSVQAQVSEMVVASGASVHGPISYVSGRDASIAPDAQFGGSVQRSAPPTRTPNPWVIGGIDLLAFVRGFIGLAVLGVLFALVFPRATMTASDIVQRRWLASLGLGFGLLVGIPVLAVVVTVVGAVVGGWWMGLMLFAAYAIFAVLGYLTFAEWTGSTISRYAKWTSHPVLSVLLGLAILGVVTLIPFVGGLVALVAVAVGLGALTLAGWWDYQAVRVTSTPTVSAPMSTPIAAAAR